GGEAAGPQLAEPQCTAEPPPELGASRPEASVVAGREVWLVHPWNLGDPPPGLSEGTLVVGVLVDDFHRAWPWTERRWR
ncbi:hypothetical protein Q6335_27930, partial [Klebsiella pneumoniae]|uniref:hypothetical protein n=1 Tax=Klebsiella pneumoniae TaxID=573 RepID=UPI0027317E0B